MSFTQYVRSMKFVTRAIRTIGIENLAMEITLQYVRKKLFFYLSKLTLVGYSRWTIRFTIERQNCWRLFNNRSMIDQESTIGQTFFVRNKQKSANIQIPYMYWRLQ